MSTVFDWTALAEQVDGQVVADHTNVNGRFVTIETDDPRTAVYALTKAAKPHFAHVSLPSWLDVAAYSFTVTTKRPSLLAPGLIYEKGAFGQVTSIEIVRRTT